MNLLCLRNEVDFTNSSTDKQETQANEKITRDENPSSSEVVKDQTQTIAFRHLHCDTKSLLSKSCTIPAISYTTPSVVTFTNLPTMPEGERSTLTSWKISSSTHKIDLCTNLLLEEDIRPGVIAELDEIQRFVWQLDSFDENVKVKTARALANLSCLSENQKRIGAHADAIPKLVALLDTPNDELKKQAARALANLACLADNQRFIRAHTEAIPKLVALLESPNAKLQQETVIALANLVYLPDNQRIVRACADAMPQLVALHDPSPDAELKKGAVKAVANEACLSENQRFIGFNTDVIPKLITILDPSSDAEIKKQAVKALSNLANLP